MKKLRKWAIVFAVVLFVILAVPARTLFVSAAENNIASGKDGDITWVIDADGKLTVTGSGDCLVLDEDGDSLPLWHEYQYKIKSAKINVTNMTDASNLFSGCESLTNLDMSNFDTSNVTSMDSMFFGCRNLTNLDVSNFNTSKVKSMKEMFRGCSSLSNLDLSNFDTSNVTSMSGMFWDCRNLTNLDVSNFDTSKVERMSTMFCDCSSLINLDLSNFDTSKVRGMSNMFVGCRSLTNLNVSNFDTSKIKSMASMFFGCRSLTNLNISNFDTSNVDYMGLMFEGCSSLVNLDLSNFDTSKVEDMTAMFENCSSLTNVNLSSFDTSKVKDMCSMFEGCSSLTSLDLSSFNLLELEDEYGDHSHDGDDAFEYGNILTGCDKLSTINTPYNLTTLIPLPTTGWHFLDGTAIAELPRNFNSSVIITRQSMNNKDDNNQNNNNTTPDNPDSSTGNTSQDKPGDSNSTGEDHNTQNNFWNTGGEQNGAISGVLEGSTNPTDVVSYGTRRLTVSPHTFNTILLSWDSVPAANSYEIFFSTSPDSGFKRLANVKKTTYKFSRAKCGVTYYFQMRVCQKGAKSEFGPVSYAKTDLTGSTTLQIKKTTYNSVQLKWSKVPGAKKYEIFYADSMGGNWQSLGAKGGTSFTHKKLVTGATYYYQIRPVRDSFYGTWSNGVSTTTALGDVSKLKVKAASSDRMKVSWKKVNGASQYVILRAESIDGTYEVVGHANKTAYIDTGLKSNTTYFYKVYAVSGPYRTKETAPVGQTTKIAKK